MKTLEKEAKNLYDFPVRLSEIKTGDIVIPNKLAVIREDTNKPIGVVSDKYSLIKHSEAIEIFRDALKNNKYEENIELIREGAQLFGTYKLTDMQIEVAKNDNVAMQIILKNSYDGSKSFQLILGAFRVACSNGMVIGREFFSFSQKHISVSNSLLNVKNNVSELISRFQDNLPIMQEMHSKKLSTSSDDLYSNKNISMPKYLLKEARENFESNETQTVWNYYNSLTYAITHKMKKEKPNARFYYLEKAWEKALTLTK